MSPFLPILLFINNALIDYLYFLYFLFSNYIVVLN